MRIETSISIEAPPSRVWDILVDVERWHEWTRSISSIRRLDDGHFQVGSRVRIKQPRFPPAFWRVTRLEAPIYMEWQAAAPLSRVIAGHRIEPEGAGSRVTLQIEQTGLMGLVGRYFANVSRAYVQMEAEGLKRRAEGT
ncbi:MAG TPA: SRPBCC family protein [Dehalococcoidia bacterium]|nr:SRPBCC family protein [Dehalococcoidia bacterium]